MKGFRAFLLEIVCYVLKNRGLMSFIFLLVDLHFFISPCFIPAISCFFCSFVIRLKLKI